MMNGNNLSDTWKIYQSSTMGKKNRLKKLKASKKANDCEIKIPPTQEDEKFYQDENKVTTEKYAEVKATTYETQDDNFY